MDFQTLDAIAPVAPEWDELATRAGASPFLRPGWFEAWWHSFGRGRLRIVTVRRVGRLAGVAPLVRHWGTTLAAANVHSPEFGFLAEDLAAERGLAEHVFERRPLHTSLCYLPEGTRMTDELYRAARDHRRRLFTVVMQRSPYLELDGDWEGFEQALSPKFVKDLHRRRRALEGAGRVTVEVDDGTDRLDEVFRLEASGWKDRRGTAILSKPKTRRFYEEVAAWAAPRGYLRLAFLRLDSTALAVQYALEDGGRWYFLKGGVDPDAKRYAAGKLLVHALVERSFARRLTAFEFLGDAEPWKLDWQPETRELLLQHSFPRTPLGVGWNSAIAAWRLVGLPLARRTLGRARG
jgi:CelD/BcsL family acetyltransferase involved in cellulose biosynthesis